MARAPRRLIRRALAMSGFTTATAGIAACVWVATSGGSHLWHTSIGTTIVGLRIERWSAVGIVLRMQPRPPFRRLPDDDGDYDRTDPYTRGSRLLLRGGRPDHTLAGFGYVSDTAAEDPSLPRDFPFVAAGYIAVMPAWFTVAAPIVAGAVLVGHRPHWEKTPGLCRRCGYDLRATPERCPERGTVSKAADVTGGATGDRR